MTDAMAKACKVMAEEWEVIKENSAIKNVISVGKYYISSKRG